MSDIFETETDEDEAELKELEDSDADGYEDYAGGSYVFPHPLYRLKLDYSSEAIYATAPKNLTLKPGDRVLLPTRYGSDLARNLGKSENPVGIRPSDLVEVIRLATPKDIEKYEELESQVQQAGEVFRDKVKKHGLAMKLIAIHFLVGEPKVLFFFSSDSRVDFRELVKDLVAVFKMRIELRQIGVRDESRITGGLGICGRPFCCHCISEKLPSVSIRMAKEQNLSLNSSKISGQCGRLLCCLSYESKVYEDAKRGMPPDGTKFFWDDTAFRVTAVNAITKMLQITGADGRVLEVQAGCFKKTGGKWKLDLNVGEFESPDD
ncbi:MAG: hypothetical protein IJU95_04565 [Treponema sp.]|nr:hypothetical protein [Treponema sp.]